MPHSSFSFDIKPEDLYTRDGLVRLHKIFLSFLKDGDFDLYQKLITNYEDADFISEDDHEKLCVDVAPFIEDFISYLFNIFNPVQFLQEQHKTLSIISTVKRIFIQRYVLHQITDIPSEKPSLPIQINQDRDFDLDFSKNISPYLQNIEANKELLIPFVVYALWAIKTEEGKILHRNSTLFKVPVKKIDLQTLKESLILEDGLLKSKHQTHMTGSFSCTEKGLSLKQTLDQTNYCIKCHPQKKDSCKKGINTPNGNTLEGCPLKEKISAFITIKNQGYSIGALAIICVDNPMVAATGKRICNDCKKACIYQKQEAVDVPGVESNVLQSVLNLPFGFEIYSLLTRWNPLNIQSPYPKEKTNHTVLVVGQGPAGFSLSHHLMRDGIGVFAIDGLKIESIPSYLKDTTQPIKCLFNVIEDLDTRKIYGFGGVSEYGITIRWDKNNLIILRLLLERNPLYTLQGGVLFGSQLTTEQALEDYKVDHIAICTGAGSPKDLLIDDQFPNGVRFASDFLMALQLTGAFKEKTTANLTIDLPIVVIGGGLTAVDTATEALRYYIRQIEKVSKRVETLKQQYLFDDFWLSLNEQEKEQLSRWLLHENELREEKKRCKEEKILFNALPLLHKWGGSRVVYRKNFNNAPSVNLNPEEVHHALQEGIFFKENFTPLSFNTDKNNCVIGIVGATLGQKEVIHARSVLIAVGTNNT